MRAERQTALLRVVDEPAVLRSSQHLETAAVADKALVLLQLANGAAQRGRRQQDEADHIEAARPHLAPSVEAKGGVARQFRGGAPEAGDVVHRPAQPAQALVHHPGARQQVGAGHALALSGSNDGIDPTQGDAGR